VAPIEAWRGQDERSRVEASFRAHRPGILAFAIRRQPDRQAADDAAAETFAVVWRRRDLMPDLPLPWLYGIALGVLADQRRSTNRRRGLEKRAAADRTLSTSADDRVEIIDRRQLFHAAFAHLDDDDEEILWLIAWEGLGPASAVELRCAARISRTPFAAGAGLDLRFALPARARCRLQGSTIAFGSILRCR
jgi:RNA polymerase sigma-70 factor (ECF subfamily)